MATYTNPSQQHAEQAKQIMARRANSKSNDKPAPKKSGKPVTPTVDKTPDVVVAKVPEASGNIYAGKDVKELRAMCKARTPKIKCTKKDTVAELIAKLEG